MPLETVHLPSDEHYPQRTAAAFLSIVAYPSNLNKRRRFELAAGSSVLRRRALDNHEWATTPQTVTPGLLLMNPQKVDKTLDDCGLKIITRRLPAAQMAGTIMADDATKQFDPEKLANAFRKVLGGKISKAVLKIRVGIEQYDPETEGIVLRQRPPTVNALAEFTAQTLNRAPTGWAKRKAKGWTRENVISRIWTPTKPVLHLALVLWGVIDSKFGGRAANMRELLEGDWVPNAVRCAEAARLVIAESDRFRINEHQMIQVLLKSD